MSKPEEVQGVSSSETAPPTPPTREGLQEAEEALRGLRMGKSRDDEGILQLNTGTPGGLQNACARLNPAEHFLDVREIYKDSGLTEEDIKDAFVQGVQHIDEYTAQGRRGEETKTEIFRMSRAFVRLAVQGGFVGTSEADNENRRLLDTIKQGLHPKMEEQERPKGHVRASLDVEEYRKRPCRYCNV